MNWISLALLAPFIYAVNVFLDKYLISAKIPEYRSLPIFGMCLAFPVALILWIVSGFELTNTRDGFLIIATGVLTIWAFSLYLEALIKEETSLLIILIQLIPVIVLTLSYFILGETITGKQLIGFVLLLASSIFISIRKEKKAFKFSRALIFILLADILWSIPYILIKFLSSSFSFPSLIMYESIGVVLGGMFLLIFIPQTRKAFFKTVKKVKKPILGLVLLNESLYLGAKIITYLALTLGPVALISILGSTQIFFGILFGVVLTFLLPKIFKEDVSKKMLIKKAFLGSMAFIGIILVS